MDERKIPDRKEENKNTENEVKDTALVSSTINFPEQLDVDLVFNNLHKLQEQISNIVLSDNSFKSAVERVRRKQAARLLDLNRKLFGVESKTFNSPLEASLSQETIDMFLEETGVKAEIEAKKNETDEAIATLRNLLEKAEHDIVILSEAKENLKTEVKTTKAENSTLQQELAFQEETKWKLYDELQALSMRFYGTPEITDAFKRCTKHLDHIINNKSAVFFLKKKS